VSTLTEGRVRIETPAGARICGPDGKPGVRLVADGLLRIVRVVPDGRTITQRYLRRGDISGVGTPFHGLSDRPTGRCEALTHSIYYELRPEVWRDLAEKDVTVALALLSELARVSEIAVGDMADRALASVRQRVVGQLLDAADRDGAELCASVTQQQLAEGTGSAREVVARVLQTLREERLVATRVGRVTLLDPARLRSELPAL
jgi:CRP/FNR family transcriptional regulator